MQSWSLRGAAALALARDAADAAPLLGVAVAAAEPLAVADQIWLGEQVRAETAAAAREQLGDAEFESAMARGRAMSAAEAAELALGYLD